MGGSPYPALFLMMLVGAALFGVGSMLVRSANRNEPETPPAPAPFEAKRLVWTRAFVEDEEPVSVELRLDMIERLTLLHQGWCESILRIIVAEETDPVVLAAGRDALAHFVTASR